MWFFLNQMVCNHSLKYKKYTHHHIINIEYLSPTTLFEQIYSFMAELQNYASSLQSYRGLQEKKLIEKFLTLAFLLQFSSRIIHAGIQECYFFWDEEREKKQVDVYDITDFNRNISSKYKDWEELKSRRGIK